jgi:hypothetical protein
LTHKKHIDWKHDNKKVLCLCHYSSSSNIFEDLASWTSTASLAPNPPIGCCICHSARSL